MNNAVKLTCFATFIHNKNGKSRPITVDVIPLCLLQVGIPHLGDTSICHLSHKQLLTMGVGELQLIVNDLLSQIEGRLVRLLLIIVTKYTLFAL